jgi:hypothetical protein
MQKAMIGWFNEGAFPREVPTVVSVSNVTLIDLNPPKLLSAPNVHTATNLTGREARLTDGDIAAMESKSIQSTNKKSKKSPKRSKE